MTASLGLLAAPLTTSAQVPKPPVSLRPFKPTALAVTRTAAVAQIGPRSKPLEEAWALYRVFKGSWMKGAPRPKAEHLAALDCLKADLEKDGFPPWFFELRARAGKPYAVTPVLDVKAPRFAATRETGETERIKALGIVHLAEHELDRAGAAEEGAAIISALVARTPLDFELHALYARFLLDAKLPTQALEEARYAIYLDPNPGRGALEFTAFVGLVAAKDGWVLIQAMLREAALNQDDAESVIKEYAPRFAAK